jgi:hypothetical protein
MCMHLCLVGALMALACLSLAERSRRAATTTNECTDREDALVPSQGLPSAVTTPNGSLLSPLTVLK